MELEIFSLSIGFNDCYIIESLHGKRANSGSSSTMLASALSEFWFTIRTEP